MTKLAPDLERENQKSFRTLVILIVLLLLTLLSIWMLGRAGKDAEGESAEPKGLTAAALTEGNLTDDRSIQEFLKRYIKSGESQEPAAELSFYADQVEMYFEKPNYDKAAILKDRESYLKKWPERTYNVVGEPAIVERSGDAVVARVNYEYAVKNAEKEAKGTGESFLRLRQDGKELEIFWVGEKLN